MAPRGVLSRQVETDNQKTGIRSIEDLRHFGIIRFHLTFGLKFN